MTSPDPVVIEAGAKARITEDTPELTGGKTWAAGTEFEVEDYVSAEDAEDGIPFYWGSISGGANNVAVAASVVEQSMSREAMRARQLPSIAEFTREASTVLCGISGESFSSDEAEVDGKRILVYGETHDGLRYAATVQLIGIEYADF